MHFGFSAAAGASWSPSAAPPQPKVGRDLVAPSKGTQPLGMLGALSLSKRRRPYTRFGDRQHHSRNTVRLHESSQAPEDQAEPQSNPIHFPGNIGAHLSIDGGASGMGGSPAPRPCALARVHGPDPAFARGNGGQVACATLLASRARARRHRQSGDAPSPGSIGGLAPRKPPSPRGEDRVNPSPRKPGATQRRFSY